MRQKVLGTETDVIWNDRREKLAPQWETLDLSQYC